MHIFLKYVKIQDKLKANKTGAKDQLARERDTKNFVGKRFIDIKVDDIGRGG